MSSSSLKKSPEDESIRTLYVGGIYGRITEQDLRDHFSAYSELESITMVPQRTCAYVTYTSRKGAEKAANELSDYIEIKGLRLKLMWGRLKTPQNEERQRSDANNNLLPQLQQTQMIQPPATATATDPHRMAASTPVKASEGVSSVISGERVENRTMPSGGKRSLDLLEGMSPQEMRETLMRRKKGSSTSTPSAASSSTVVPPVSAPDVAVATQVGATTEETPLIRFFTSFPRDFLLHKSGVTTLWPDADSLLFPGPKHLLEKKSNIELVNDFTEMALQSVQSALMTRRRLLGELGQEESWRIRLDEAEAAEARMSSQLREATTQIESLKEAQAAQMQSLKEAHTAQIESLKEAHAAQIRSLKEAAAAAEARAAAAVEARDARETLLMTADAQLREMTEKMRLKSEEKREELKDAALSAGLRARAKLMREFLDGKSSSWDPQAEIDFYVAHIGEEADLVS